MTTVTPTIDFRRIRLHRGTQHGGFEELAVQLFRSDCGTARDFTRIEGAGGDGGVEAFLRLPNGSEIGLQAKYFAELEEKQWRQIDRSVDSALKNHPDLIEYRIAVPLDRTPDQKTKWDARIEKWCALAKENGINQDITFVWWGASELLHLLTDAKHAAKVLYWFGCPQFSDDWIASVNAGTLQALDRRYTPAHHVKTDSEDVLEAFTFAPGFCDVFTSAAEKVLREFHDLNGLGKLAQADSSLAALHQEFSTQWRTLRERLGNGSARTPFRPLIETSTTTLDSVEKIASRLGELDWSARQGKSVESPFSYDLHQVRRFGDELHEFIQFLNRFSCVDSQMLLVIGEAGSGKSHLLASCIEACHARKQPALIMLGELFTSAASPWQQFVDLVHWNHETDALLSVLDHAAELFGSPAVICIDALNETPSRRLWKLHLPQFASHLKKYPNIRLIVSCRSDFTKTTLPDALRENRDPHWASVRHDGFGSQLFKAITVYFKGYNVRSDYFPPLLAEFDNPLFLKTVCEAFENSRLPAGHLTLKAVMERRVEKLCERLQDTIDCQPYVTRKAIELITDEMAARHEDRVPLDEIRPKVEALFSGRGHSESLYVHLRSNGFLVEVGDFDSEDIFVRFQFERFADYFLAERTLADIPDAASLATDWSGRGFAEKLTDRQFIAQNAVLLRMLAILVAEKFQTELVDFIPGQKMPRQLLEDFLASICWRSSGSFSRRSDELMDLAFQQRDIECWLDDLISVCAVPGHRYNADFLHRVLNRLSLADRDAWWTISINTVATWGDESGPGRLISWAASVPRTLVPDVQALLVTKVLCWFFASSHRRLRDRATEAAIHLLQGRSRSVIEILAAFDTCNDPYVVERVYAVAAGVAMREKDLGSLAALADAVWDRVFSGSEVRPHILLREYARCVLEVAYARECLPSRIRVATVRPPYKSNWPDILPEERVQEIENDETLSRIVWSIRPESMGMYGDFGRYVMGSNVQHFQMQRLTEAPALDVHEDVFDDKIARRWVLQRVLELGWTDALFGDYEKGIRYVGREPPVHERISKKYQWIALHELLGFLSDHNHMSKDWGDEVVPTFQGTWQLPVRDFDPSKPTAANKPSEDCTQQMTPWSCRYPDPFSDAKLCVDRAGWVNSEVIADFSSLIDLKETQGHSGSWLTLCGYYSWDERLPFGQRKEENGELHMWLHIRSWIVDKGSLRAFLRELQSMHFWGHGCQLPELRQEWFGEYPWSASCDWVKALSSKDDSWLSKVKTQAKQSVADSTAGMRFQD
jgi:hypothetical protein